MYIKGGTEGGDLRVALMLLFQMTTDWLQD